VGRLAAASGKSQPVFYGRCGILTVARRFRSELKESRLQIHPSARHEKTGKQRNHKRPARQLPERKQGK
jgi:hypothetical protein